MGKERDNRVEKGDTKGGEKGKGQERRERERGQRSKKGMKE